MRKSDTFFDDPHLEEKIKSITVKAIKNSLKITPALGSTYIVVLVFHKDPDKNYLRPIKYDKGIPISGHLYDTQSKSYYIECHDMLLLGVIPVSFFMSMKNVGNWNPRIPLPETVIKKYLNIQQKKDLKNFKNGHEGNQYSFQYLQMVDCY